MTTLEPGLQGAAQEFSMKLYSTTAALLLAAGGSVLLLAAACSSPSSDAADENTTSVGLQLTLPDGSILNTATYVVTGPNSFTKSGSIDVSMSSTVSALLTLPAGGPYSITISGTTTDSSATCGGSASFSVTAGVTTPVPVHLTCRQTARTGGVTVSGNINLCPSIDGIEASPAEVYVGKTLSLSAVAHDSDAGPSPLSYSWTSTGGAFSSATSATPTFTCTKAGTQTVNLSVSDGDSTANCAATASVAVTCSNPPYLVPVAAGVITRPFFTVGDSVNLKPDGVTPYRMVGIPDGLGAKDNGDGTFTMFSNHELSSGGVARAHGGTGAFVSKWIVKKATLAVQNGSDLIQTVSTWNTTTSSYNAPTTGQVFSRFCSADLGAVSAFYDVASGKGYDGQFFMNGEESGTEGKAWIHGLGGVSWEFPRMGKASWENIVANPGSGQATVVAGTDDTSPAGQVYVYIGAKNTTGTSDIDKAGLTNGTLYGVAVAGVTSEPSATGIPSGTAFTLANLGNVENNTGAQLETAGAAAGVTGFLRPEDAAWDPVHPNDLYFVTTSSFTTPSRLWRLRFSDVNNFAAGGTLDMLLDGTEGQKMLDNITVDKKGHVMLVEDVGSQAHIGKVWRYDIATDALTQIAQHNLDLFTPGAPAFLTQDEEASGIVDASSILGSGWFLVDVQAHYTIPGELYEGGQYLAIFDPAAQ
jgi:hypothetical protein